MLGCYMCAMEAKGKLPNKIMTGFLAPGPCACKKALEYEKKWSPNKFKTEPKYGPRKNVMEMKAILLDDHSPKTEVKGGPKSEDVKLPTRSSWESFGDSAIHTADIPKKKPGRPKKRA